MKHFIIFLKLLEELGLLFWDVVSGVGSIPRNLKECVEEMHSIGAQSVPIIGIGGLFTGIILSLEAGYRFDAFGAKSMVGITVSLGMIRELGLVVSGLLFAARVGAKNASELGSMQLSEQVDAMRASGANPVQILVLPRCVAGVVMFLPLVLIADAAGILSGMVISVQSLHVDPAFFLQIAIQHLQIKDLIVGFIKPIFFGFFISLISCYYGLSTSGGTTGLGKSTINAVVSSTLVVLLLDFVVTKLIWAIP